MGILSFRIYPSVERASVDSYFFSPLMIIACILGIPVTVVFGIAAQKCGREKSYVIVMTLLVLITAPLLIMGGLNFFNGLLDVSKPTNHQTRILSKRAERGKSGTRYKLLVKDWENPKHNLSFRLEPQIYANHDKGDKITVITRKGLFGREWVQTIVLNE